MQGKVLSFNLSTGRGKITLKDGNVVSFTRDEWNLPIRPQANILVEYMRGDIVMPVGANETPKKVEKPLDSNATQELSDNDVNRIMAELEAKEKAQKVLKASTKTQQTATTKPLKAKPVATQATLGSSSVKQANPVKAATPKQKIQKTTEPTQNAQTRPLVKAAKGHIELMKVRAAQEEKRKEGCQAEAYIEKKLAEGYKLVEKDEQHFILAQKHANRSILNRAQRWLLYTIPMFLAFVIFADDMSIARSILDTLLEINVILLFGTLATLYWQGYVSEAFKVEVKGNCDMDKLIVDDSQEVEFYMKRTA